MDFNRFFSKRATKPTVLCHVNHYFGSGGKFEGQFLTECGLNGRNFCIDLLAMPGGTAATREFQQTSLGAARNRHSGLALLSREQMKYARDRICLSRREKFVVAYMASAYANLHQPFFVYLPHYLVVVNSVKCSSCVGKMAVFNSRFGRIFRSRQSRKPSRNIRFFPTGHHPVVTSYEVFRCREARRSSVAGLLVRWTIPSRCSRGLDSSGSEDPLIVRESCCRAVPVLPRLFEFKRDESLHVCYGLQIRSTVWRDLYNTGHPRFRPCLTLSQADFIVPRLI